MTATDPRGLAWPVLRTYDEEHQLRVAMPLGGIGTGTVSLGGRGDLRDWELEDHPNKGFSPPWSFFALRVEEVERVGADGRGRVEARLLEGPVDPVLYEGAHGSPVPRHGLPRFAGSRFEVAYPLAQVAFEDPSMPVDVRLQAFNPLVPTDADASGIPLAAFRYLVTNRASGPVDVSLVGSLTGLEGDRFERRDDAGAGLRGVALASGKLALASVDEPDVSRRTSWSERASWGGDILDFWDDFAGDGRIEQPADSAQSKPVGSVCAARRLEPGETRAFVFLLGWRFPDRMDWNRENVVGNYYATRYPDAWNVLQRTLPELEDLERRTVGFVSALCDSDLPPVVKEAALFNVSTLRTQTCFRTPDGKFWGWEGCNDDSGCCLGNCTHVWNYEQATPFLFGALSRTMRETEFRLGTGEDGHMVFRVQLPLDRARSEGVAAADGQMGCLVKLYRDWRLSGDDELLRSLWPKAKQALEFAWVPGGWDADRDGVMEGSQHNTMDVEYFGPNPQMGSWYLAALRAAEEMARYLGDDAFADECARLFGQGSVWLDENLFDGDYYRHEIRPLRSEEDIAPGLRLTGVGARDVANPDFQLGDGCLVDQLVGQFLAHVAGLGYLLDKGNVGTTLRSVVRYNRRQGSMLSLNPMRSYVMGDETALTMASYPKGNRPIRPFPYFAEVMTGFEYTAAVGLMYEGMVDEGVHVIADIRERYDGRRRNPFDEAECGHHYARAMASWAAILALTGFSYDGVTRSLAVKESSTPARWFWSNGYAYGTISQPGHGSDHAATLEVLGGELRLRALHVGGRAYDLGDRTLGPGDTVTVGPATAQHSSAE